MHRPSPASLNPFTDADLSDGALRTFTLLCKLDRGPRGCFARRDTLAKWRGLSVSAINHQIADLKRRGYITLSRKGRKAGESSSIHVVDQARYALLSLLPDELRSQLLNGEERNCTCSDSGDSKLQISANGKLQKSTNLQKSANGHVIKEYCSVHGSTTEDMVQGTKADVESTPDPVVVSLNSVDGFTDAPKPDASSNESRPARSDSDEKDGDPVARVIQLPLQSQPRSDFLSGVQALMEAGIDEANALQLGRTYPAPRCRAAIAYVRDKGLGVKNPGGYIRFLLENDASIPTQYFKRDLSDDDSHATGLCRHGVSRYPEPDSTSNVIPLSAAERYTTVPAVSFGPGIDVCPDREKRRAKSPYSNLWEEVSENIGTKIQPQSFETWFQPLFITEITDTTVVFDAPEQLIADWVGINYADFLTSELEAVGLSGRSISIETSTPSS